MWLSPPQFAAQVGENNSEDSGNINMACHYPEVSPALACQKTEMFIGVLCLGLGLSLCLLIEISLVGASHVYLTILSYGPLFTAWKDRILGENKCLP